METVYIMQVRMINRVKKLEKGIVQVVASMILGGLLLVYFQGQNHQRIQGRDIVCHLDK